MSIRKDNGDERSIQRVGLVRQGLREDDGHRQSNGSIQEVESQGREAEAEAVYNRTEEGDALQYPGKLSGKRKLRDADVIRLRRNEEQLSYNQWAVIYRVAPAVIWNAIKGFTYKHLNWRHPPIR